MKNIIWWIISCVPVLICQSKYEDYSYFGLLIKNSNDLINKLIVFGLESILQEYGELKGQEIENIIHVLKHNNQPPEFWRYPRDFHVTTVYDPGRHPKHPACQKFIERNHILIKVKGIVYIPNKIISFFILTDTPILNKIPHLTALLKEYKAKNSNDIMESIFGPGKSLENLYYFSIFRPKLPYNIITEIKDIEVLGKKEAMYVAFFQRDHSLNSIMTSYEKRDTGQ